MGGLVQTETYLIPGVNLGGLVRIKSRIWFIWGLIISKRRANACWKLILPCIASLVLQKQLKTLHPNNPCAYKYVNIITNISVLCNISNTPYYRCIHTDKYFFKFVCETAASHQQTWQNFTEHLPVCCKFCTSDKNWENCKQECLKELYVDFSSPPHFTWFCILFLIRLANMFLKNWQNEFDGLSVNSPTAR